MEVNDALMKRLRYDTGCGLYDAKECLLQSSTYVDAVKLAKDKVHNKRLT